MKKLYVLDTNVLLRDFTAIYAFEDNTVIIPSVVLEELDTKKKLMDGLGLNARAFSREADELRKTGKFHEGIPLHNGGIVKSMLVPFTSPVYETFMEKTNDNAILATALELQVNNPDVPVIVVSLDVNVRIKADVVGLTAEDYQSDKVLTSADDQYKGFTVISDEDVVQDINDFYRDKQLPFTGNENEFVIMKNGSQSALGRVRGGMLRPLYYYTGDPVWGLKAFNVQQAMALDLLLDDEVKLVTITGKAGTGKTLMALAAALQQTLDSKIYRKILVARPVIPMGKDIGYLPGEKEEKLRPWMQPIYDNLEHLFDTKKDGEIDRILTGMSRELQVEALTYIRGRSIPNQLIIIDEAQNLNKHEVKTILTRAGEGAKVILVGDPEQIDHPYLDQFSNGLTYVVETMKEQSIVGHVHLVEGERSELAELCANLL
jgi:PhoH-like ATPase